MRRARGPREMAPGVHLLRVGRTAAASNVYLVRSGGTWVLVDAGWPGSAGTITAAAKEVSGPGNPPAGRPPAVRRHVARHVTGGEGDTMNGRTQHTIGALALTAGLMLALSACAAGANPAVTDDGSGFWLGLWHGIILPVTFVISLFTDTVNIYEADNNGNWYDFGFVLGLVLFSGPAMAIGRR